MTSSPWPQLATGFCKAQISFRAATRRHSIGEERRDIPWKADGGDIQGTYESQVWLVPFLRGVVLCVKLHQRETRGAFKSKAVLVGTKDVEMRNEGLNGKALKDTKNQTSVVHYAVSVGCCCNLLNLGDIYDGKLRRG